MNESRCSVCGMNLTFGRTRTRVLDAMKSRGHTAFTCHPDGSSDRAEMAAVSDGQAAPVGDMALREKLEGSS